MSELVPPEAERTEEWPWQRTAESVCIPANAFLKNRKHQGRAKLDIKKAGEYAEGMRLGAKYPPLNLSLVKGKLILSDGWHRHHAAVALNGHEAVEAIITERTAAEACAAAFEANSNRGLPYSRADREPLLRLYIGARKHRDGKGYKSLRVMAAELLIPKSTLNKLLWKNHPEIAENMSAESAPVHKSEGAPVPMNSDGDHFQGAVQALEDALGLANALKSPEVRFDLLKRIDALRAQVAQKAHVAGDF